MKKRLRELLEQNRMDEIADLAEESRRVMVLLRSLTFDRDPESGAATCEVSHEALLAGWERLAGWLDDARSDIAQLDGLTSAAADAMGRQGLTLGVGPSHESVVAGTLGLDYDQEQKNLSVHGAE